MEKTNFTHRQFLPVEDLTQAFLIANDYNDLIENISSTCLKWWNMRTLFLVLILLNTSCTLITGGKDSPATAKGSQYSIHFEKENWRPADESSSDYVFENKNDGRILLSNSFCGEFQEQTLENLANKTFETVKDFKAFNQEYIAFNKREAYRLSGTGLVDGVKVNLNILNTRRNNCYFDFVFISPVRKIAEKDNVFDDFLQSVKFR